MTDEIQHLDWHRCSGQPGDLDRSFSLSAFLFEDLNKKPDCQFHSRNPTLSRDTHCPLGISTDKIIIRLIYREGNSQYKFL